MRMYKRWFVRLASLLFWLYASSVLAAGIQVEPDRNPVGLGEDFLLTFTVDGMLGGNPDFSPLQNNFQILGTSTSSNMQLINGAVSQQTSWQLRLIANEVGTLQVPPIKFGAEVSPAVNITVQEEVPDAAAAGDDKIIVELEADTTEPYVQQQVVITQRLLHAVPLQRTQASMSHPELVKGKGILQQLGNARNLSVQRNGITYQAIERRYAVFPQTRGEMTLGRTVFEGVLDDPRSRQRDPFGMSGQQVRRFSKPLTLNVQPQASNQVVTWLPAHNLTLNAYWQHDASKLKAGEPVTLTLAVMAEGLMAEQLPALEVKPPVGIKGYASQPDFRNDASGDNIIGIREEKWTLIGTADGQFVLPEMSVKWWNLAKGALETATIPATTLTISGAGVAARAVPPAEPAGQTPAAPGSAGLPGEGESHSLLEPVEAGQNAPLASSQDQPESDPGVWLLLAATGGSVLLLLGLVVYWRRKPAGQAVRQGKQSPAVPVWHQLQRACQRNDAAAAAQLLPIWIRNELQLSPPTIAHLRSRGDDHLVQALDELNTVLYAAAHDLWEGRGLWDALQAFAGKRNGTPSTGNTTANDDLAALYPE